MPPEHTLARRLGRQESRADHRTVEHVDSDHLLGLAAGPGAPDVAVGVSTRKDRRCRPAQRCKAASVGCLGAMVSHIVTLRHCHCPGRVCRRLDDTGAFVVNVDKLTYGVRPLPSIPQASGNSRYALAKVDICNGQALRALFEHIQTGCGYRSRRRKSRRSFSIDGPAEFIQTNIVGTFTLLEETLRYWRSLYSAKRAMFRFLHVSTDEVYGSLGSKGLFRRRRLMPDFPYSASKAASDISFGRCTRLTIAGAGHQLLEQLWAVPIPRKLIPLVTLNVWRERCPSTAMVITS